MARDVTDSKRLFRRKGSDIWYWRLVVPADTTKDGKRKVVEKSTGLTDKDAANIAAADQFNAHRKMMLARRQARVARIVFDRGPWTREYEPGPFTTPDGRTGIATATDLTFSDGTRLPNGGPIIWLESPQYLTAAQQFKALDDAHEGRIGEGVVKTDRPTLLRQDTDPDSAIIENYITNGSVKKRVPLNPTRAKEARAIWATFKHVVEGKALKDCTRDDGRKLVAHLEAATPGIKSATVRRALVPLVSAVNRAIDEGRHAGINPFESVAPNRKDSEKPEGFTDDDMRTIKANLHKLRKADQLLLRVLASTGMDRGEAFSIKGERVENGVRYCIIGTKTDARPRRVPFPKALLPHLPKVIKGPLFTARKDTTSKRITEFLTDIGVKGGDDGRKLSPLHSFRHRAATKLRQAKVDPELRYALGGWKDGAKPNSGWTYGEWPIKTLREAIDHIGGL
jgi:integrase